MLETLDQIDWASLSHAYGSAKDVPELIRQRASTDLEEAEEAEGEMFGNIWHQGTVYEATAFAVPFLVELVERRETRCREGLVLLLASIAEGSSFLEVHKDLSHYASQGQTGIEAQLIKELDWKTRAQDAVQRFAGAYWALLDDPSLRVSIPYLLAKLPTEAPHVRARFPDRIATADDPLFLASLLLGTTMASRTAPDVFTPFISSIESEAPTVRLAAAMGVLITGSASSPIDQALRIYFDAFRNSGAYHPNTLTWLWGKGSVQPLLLDALPFFAPAATNALLGVLPTELPTLDEWYVGDLAAELMPLGFDVNHLPRTRGELNDLQYALLTALARSTTIFDGIPLIGAVLSALGLSRERDLKAFPERSG